MRLFAALLLAATAGGPSLEVEQQIFQVEAHRLAPSALGSLAKDPDPAVRARVARALGRLRDGEARSLLDALAGDADPGVRKEAAFALGMTPDAGELLGKRWKVEQDVEVQRAVVLAWGRQGGTDAVDRLMLQLNGPVRLEAADALGRLGIRKVQGSQGDNVVAALLETFDFPIGETRRRAAWALSRMGLARTSDDNAMRMRRLVLEDGDARVRAWVLRAWAGVAGEGARAEVLARTAEDRDASVRVATARAIDRHGWKGAGPILARLLADDDPGVRLEAIGAVGSCPGVDAKGLLMAAWASGSPVERAAALRALDAKGALPAGHAELTGPEHPMVVRMAAVEALKDRNKLLSLALRAEEPAIRSAAAGALLDDEAPRPVELVELLKAKDTAISQAAADTLREHPDPMAERPLLDLLARRDLPSEVAETAVRALAAIYATGRVPRPGADAAAALTPWLRLRRLADEAPRLAALLKIELPTPKHPARKVPALADVLRVRSARVFTNEGELRIALAPEEAPYTVWNFARLADERYFDGLVFHRVVPDFVAQTGDPRGDGWGGPGYEIPDEINPLSYRRGTVGMALSGPDTGGSQWFVTLSDQPHLDGGYTAFGHVSYGMRVAEALSVGDRMERVVIERL